MLAEAMLAASRVARRLDQRVEPPDRAASSRRIEQAFADAEVETTSSLGSSSSTSSSSIIAATASVGERAAVAAAPATSLVERADSLRSSCGPRPASSGTDG